MKTFLDFLTEAPTPPAGPSNPTGNAGLPGGGPPPMGGPAGPSMGPSPMGGPPPSIGGPPPMGGPPGMDMGGPPMGGGATPPAPPPMEFKPSSVWYVISKLLKGEKVGVEKNSSNQQNNVVNSPQQIQPSQPDLTNTNLSQQGANSVVPNA